MSLTKKVQSVAAKITMSKDDVRSLLTKDHEEALQIAKKMHETKGAAARKVLLNKLKPALAAHSRAEESEVYDRLIETKSDDSQDIGNEGYVEHSLLDELLERLGKGDSGSDTWKAEAKVLYELLQHHIDEEQTEMYADLGQDFDSDQLNQMGTRFLKAKQAILKSKKAA
jgi:hemerythrin-like domain-containing protein